MNRLQRATIYGAFEDKFTKADLLMGTADQDYHGSKEVEEDITDQTQVKLDFAARSLILDLQTEADNISKVELIPEVTGHRVPVEQIEIYYRNGFAFNKLARNKWVGTKDANGRITIKFTPLLETGELKIHCNYDDLDLWQMPLIDRSEFFNIPEKLVTVYQKFASRTENYEYDALGNRTVERILLRKEYGYTYTYYPNSNRLQSKVKQDGTERVDYAYDENGNLTSKIATKGNKIDTWEYAYDLLNQLEQVKKNGVVVSSYIYDPNGFRVEKVGSKGKFHYVPLLNGEVGYRKEFSSNKEYSFIYVGIQHLARVNGVIGGSGKKFYYHNDHLGSALAITDEYGNKVVERDFTPFGERINVDVYDDEPRDLEEDESGFTGKDWDEDVRLYYYNARWYDQGVGRFISEDSEMDDPNGYGYCFNNPVNNIDPTGHWAVNVNWNNFLATAIKKTIWNLLPPEATGVLSLFQTFIGGKDNSKWAKFLHRYTSMNEKSFKEYLESEGINYEFNDNNTTNYVFDNFKGQTALDRKQFTNGENRALKGDEKLAAFEAMKGNIKGFLENNPGLSLEQVRGVFDSAAISADNSWGLGKNEFRFEGRGSKFKGIYDAEAIIMDQGTVKGVFTRASTLPDPEYKGGTIKQGIYDYEIGLHPRGETRRPFSEPTSDATANTYAGKQYMAVNLYKGGFKDENRVLPTEYLNKVNNNQYIMVGGNSHAGFTTSKGISPRTGAEGCPTLFWPDYYDYMSLYSSGERGKFVIIR